MMWYGLIPMPLIEDEEIAKDTTTQALLITYSIFSDINEKSDIDLWETLYEPTTFYVGSADDLTIYDYKDLLLTVYGEKPNLETLIEQKNIDKLFVEAKKLSEPKIQQDWASVNTPVGKQFRFMGQRYIPDSEILQKLVDSDNRPFPRGFDVMGVLGSDRAYDQLLIYGGLLEALTASLAGDGIRWFEITSETDKNMAVIADIHTVISSYLEVGVGPASQIYVAVPIGGKIYLTRGAVFSYYEFISDARLTDEEWQTLFKENKQPAQPDWTDSFTSDKKEEIPVPAEPYFSGY